MSTDDRLTLWDLKDTVRQVVRDEAEEILHDSYPEDRIHEIADGAVPIYNHDLLEVAQSDLWLAVEEPEVFAFGGEHTAVAAIAGNIYEELRQVAYEEWEKIQRESDPVPA